MALVRSLRRFALSPLITSPKVSLVLAMSFLMMLSVFPLTVLRERAWITLHDNLDSTFVWVVNAARQGLPFVIGFNDVLPNVMNGLPRSVLPSIFNIVTVFFLLLPPIWATIANIAVVRALALIGSYALLRRIAPESRGFQVVAVWLGLLFALLPFYTIAGLTVAGLPLLLNAYLNIEQERASWLDWGIVLIFPFYSSLFLVGVFLVALIVLRATVLFLRAQRTWKNTMQVFLVLATAYALSEWPVLMRVIDRHAIPLHRAEFNSPALWAQAGAPSLPSSLFSYLFHGQSSSAILHVWPILLCILFAIARLRHSPRKGLVARLLGAIAATALLAAIYPSLERIFGPYAFIFTQFHFQRLYFILPLLWFVVFGLVLNEMLRARLLRLVVPVALVLLGGSIVRSNREVSANLAILYRGKGQTPSFGEFFDPALFGQIRERIGRPASSYRVVAVGLHPSILQYNGFYTLDSYQNMYLLAYKHRFRTVVASELNKDEGLRTYFDAWGSRCYVFSAELGKYYLWDKESGKSIRDLALNLDAFHQLGGRFLVSSVPIARIAGVQTRELGVFQSSRSFWKIYLYDLS